MADWNERTRVVAAGKSLECQCFGPSPDDATTLVLLHEGLGSAGLWRRFPNALSEATGMGVLTFSRAGYGRSDTATLPRPLDYMTREATETLPDILGAFGIRRAILLGHSDGATIAAIHAGSVFDPRVRGLILIAPHFFTEEIGLAEIAKAGALFENGDLKQRMARHHDDPTTAFRGWCDAWLDPAFREWDVTEVIDYIRVPILAIQGTADAYGTLAQIDVISERAYAPVETCILDGCGHAPFQDQPDKVIAAIAGFCRRLERIEASA